MSMEAPAMEAPAEEYHYKKIKMLFAFENTPRISFEMIEWIKSNNSERKDGPRDRQVSISFYTEEPKGSNLIKKKQSAVDH